VSTCISDKNECKSEHLLRLDFHAYPTGWSRIANNMVPDAQIVLQTISISQKQVLAARYTRSSEFFE